MCSRPAAAAGTDPGDGSGSIGGSGTCEDEVEDAGAADEALCEGDEDDDPPMVPSLFSGCCACRFANSWSLMISTMRTTLRTPEVLRATSVARSVSVRVAMPMR